MRKYRFKIRIYKNFVLRPDFLQPSQEYIQSFLIETENIFAAKFGCEIFESIKNNVLNSLLTVQQLEKYPRIPKKGEIEMLELNPNMINLIDVTVVDTSQMEIIESSKELVTGKNDIQFRASKYAEFGEKIKIEYQVMAHYEPPKEPDKIEKLIEALIEQQKK